MQRPLRGTSEEWRCRDGCDKGDECKDPFGELAKYGIDNTDVTGEIAEPELQAWHPVKLSMDAAQTKKAGRWTNQQTRDELEVRCEYRAEEQRCGNEAR